MFTHQFKTIESICVLLSSSTHFPLSTPKLRIQISHFFITSIFMLFLFCDTTSSPFCVCLPIFSTEFRKRWETANSADTSHGFSCFSILLFETVIYFQWNKSLEFFWQHFCTASILHLWLLSLLSAFE